MKNHIINSEKDVVFSLSYDDLFSEFELSKSDCRLIGEQVNHILRKRKKSSGLIDVVKIAKQLKVSTRQIEFPNNDVFVISFFEPYERKRKGIIYIREEFCITETEEDYLFRCKRYATACMLGYYVLYWKRKHLFKIDRKAEKEDKYIERIRYFARCLLLPEGMLLPALDFAKQLYKDEDGRVKCLAHAFSVPYCVVRRRFAETGITL